MTGYTKTKPMRNAQYLSPVDHFINQFRPVEEQEARLQEKADQNKAAADEAERKARAQKITTG